MPSELFPQWFTTPDGRSLYALESPERLVEHQQMGTRYMGHVLTEKLQIHGFVENILQEYKGQEAELVGKLKKKYGIKDEPVKQGGTAAAGSHSYAAQLNKLYRKHNPAKLVDPKFVAKVLERYEGREDVLMAALGRSTTTQERKKI